MLFVVILFRKLRFFQELADFMENAELDHRYEFLVSCDGLVGLNDCSNVSQMFHRQVSQGVCVMVLYILCIYCSLQAEIKQAGLSRFWSKNRMIMPNFF